MAQTPPSGGPYVVTKQVIANGGGRAAGGTFELVGTVGQHAASTPVTTAPFTLQGGFHTPQTPSIPQPDALFANGFEN